MARLVTDAFEGFSLQSGSGGSYDTSLPRTGARCFRVSSLVSANRQYRGYTYRSGAGSAHIFCRFYLRVDTLPSAANKIMQINDTTIGSTAHVTIRLTAAGALQLYDSGTQIGSDSAALDLGVWYMVEFEMDSTPSVGSRVLRAKIDGAQFASATNRSTGLGSLWSVGGNLGVEGQTTGDWRFDDIAVNSDAGSEQNSWPGEGKVLCLRPSANGDNTGWSGGFADINTIPVDDATKIAASAGGLIEDMEVDDAGLASVDTITVIQVGGRLARSGGAGNSGAKLRLKAASGGTVTESAELIPPSTNFGTNDPATPPVPGGITSYFKPGTSDPWTAADIETAQIGANLTLDSVGNVNISELWMFVEYVWAETPPRNARVVVGQAVQRAAVT